MIIPTNIVSALLIVAFVVPGFVFVTVRAGLRGPGGVQDTQLSSRITLAVVVSVVFDSVYLVAAGVVLRPADVLTLTALEPVVLAQNPLLLGGLVLALGFVIPWLVGLIAYYRVDWRSPAGGRWPSWLRRPYRRGGYRNFPTAWDRAAPALGGSFVRVRTGDGKWIGGWYSSESFVGTYPNSRDLFIERQYDMGSDGTFGREIEGTWGVWLSIGDDHVVEWVAAPYLTQAEGESR